MDYYSRENAKNRPLFLRKNYVSKEEEKTFTEMRNVYLAC